MIRRVSVAQGLDQIRSYIEQLETDLAKADALIATHQFTIDPTPPDTWPRGSTLLEAVGRHNVRCAEESLERAQKRALQRQFKPKPVLTGGDWGKL